MHDFGTIRQHGRVAGYAVLSFQPPLIEIEGKQLNALPAAREQTEVQDGVTNRDSQDVVDVSPHDNSSRATAICSS